MSALNSVARAFGLRPLADGVESQEHASWLAANGVEELQGYFVQRAEDEDEEVQGTFVQRQAEGPEEEEEPA